MTTDTIPIPAGQQLPANFGNMLGGCAGSSTTVHLAQRPAVELGRCAPAALVAECGVELPSGVRAATFTSGFRLCRGCGGAVTPAAAAPLEVAPVEAGPALLLEAGHRITLQASLTEGQVLARLEVGEHGRGRCTHYGKGDTAQDALAGLVWAERKQPPAEHDALADDLELGRTCGRCLWFGPSERFEGDVCRSCAALEEQPATAPTAPDNQVDADDGVLLELSRAACESTVERVWRSRQRNLDDPAVVVLSCSDLELAPALCCWPCRARAELHAMADELTRRLTRPRPVASDDLLDRLVGFAELGEQAGTAAVCAARGVVARLVCGQDWQAVDRTGIMESDHQGTEPTNPTEEPPR